jgi:hypothetical protein
MSTGSAPIPGWNPAIPHRSSTRPWWIAAIICWLLAASISEAIASAMGALPQQDQAASVALFRLLPALPLALVAIVAGVRSALQGRRAWSTAGVPKLLFWSSLALFLLAIPKPN